MAQLKKSVQPVALVPNRALRKVRETIGLTIGAFAKLVGVSAAYIQAVEIGQRPVSVELAEKIRDHTGAWPRSIIENWEDPVDVDGQVYTAAIYQRLTASQPESCDFKALERTCTEALVIVVNGASCVGKSSVAMSLIRDKLYEAVSRILCLDGVSETLANERATAGKLTVGQMRKQPELAKIAGFYDDPSQHDDEEIILRRRVPTCFQLNDLLQRFRPAVASHVRSAQMSGLQEIVTEWQRSDPKRKKSDRPAGSH